MEEQHMLLSERVFCYTIIYLFVFLNQKIKNDKSKAASKLTGETASDNLLNWFAQKYEISVTKSDIKSFGRYMKQHDFNIASEQKEINDVELYGISYISCKWWGRCKLQSSDRHGIIESLLDHTGH